MILWGVKIKDLEMRIVSNMAKAYLTHRITPESEVYKIDLDESGEWDVVDGPVEVIDKSGKLYGTQSLKPYVVFHILFSVIMGMAAIQAIFEKSWLAVAVVWIAYLIVHKVSNAEDRIMKDTLRKQKAFAKDMRDLLGS